MAKKRAFVILGLVWLLVVFGLAVYIVVDRSARIPVFPLPTPEAGTFTSPLHVYMPSVVKQVWTDPRFGVAEYDCEQMVALGFPRDGRFHAEQWQMPHFCNSVFFSRTDHRCLLSSCREPVPKGWPTDLYCLFAYEVEGKLGNCTGQVATRTGLVNPEGLCAFLQDRPDVSIIVGNEEFHTNPGISDGVTPVEYAVWYHEVWETVKACAPTVKVGPYGPMHWDEAKPFLLEFWEVYEDSFGQPVPMDFMSVHHYAWPGFVLQDEIDSLLEWLEWLDSHVNAPEYWLTEYGLFCWKPNVDREGPEVNRFMTGFTCWLLSTEHFQSWAWWSSCWLLRNNQPTEAGELYLCMAQNGCVATLESFTVSPIGR